jgi:hypothetical protein
MLAGLHSLTGICVARPTLASYMNKECKMNNKLFLTVALILPVMFTTVSATAGETESLVVESGFDFRTDRNLSLTLTQKPAGKGVVNVYYGYEHHDSITGIYYPDHTTRVLNFNTSSTDNVEFQINKNWQYLIVEYVPIDAQGVEQYKKIDLTSAGSLNFSF